jgi:hypothetical protein
MRILSLFFAMTLIVAECAAQATPFCVAMHKDPKRVLSQAHFDWLYTPAGEFMSADTIPVAWYQGFRPAFEKYIATVNLPWDSAQVTKVWVDLCCSPSGRIERVLYSSMGLNDVNLEKRFCDAIESFAKDFVFPLTADRPFSQCGSLQFGRKN